ncbi:MAG: GNAT family N-acetyltransferase [Clostridiales bacterium]|nr:GNAT family N-acetyltransferase [Clostridiales bacterium]
MNKSFWTGKDVILRAFDEGDLVRLAESRKSPDSRREWLYDAIRPPMTEAALRKAYSDELFDRAKGSGDRLFSIELKSGEYAGELVVFNTNPSSGVFRQGLFLEEGLRGKGFGAQALVIALDYYFNELRYRKSAPYVYAYNPASMRFHEKFGFVKEAVHREERYTRGQYHDTVYYAMFREEFNLAHGRDLWEGR